MVRPFVFASLLSLAFATACGSSVVEDGDGTGGSSSGSGGATSSSTTSSTTGAAGGEPLPCPELADQDPSATVTFHVRNDVGMPVYVPTICGRIDASLRSVGDIPADDLRFPLDTRCLGTCEVYQTQPEPPSCSECAAGVVLIEPDALVDLSWPASALRITTMDAACALSGEATECEQIVNAPADRYQIEVEGYSTCDGCQCDAETGLCQGTPGGQNGLTIGTFDLPAQTSVDVPLGVCFFGCADE